MGSASAQGWKPGRLLSSIEIPSVEIKKVPSKMGILQPVMGCRKLAYYQKPSSPLKVAYRASEPEQKPVQRFISVDPHYFNYPGWSPYHFAACNPILVTDPDGRDWYISNAEGANDEPVWLPNDADATSHFGEGAFINLGENMLDEVVVTPEGSSTGKSYNVPNYLINAKGEYGQKEIAGDKHNPRIVEYHSTTQNPETGEPYTDDETAWCASFCNWNLVESGYPSNENKYNATATGYNKWNTQYTKLDKPALGALAVIKSGSGYHVTFVVGTNGNYVHGYGGNQSDQVKVSTYNKSKVVGYYVPVGVSPNYDVPTIKHNFNKKSSESTR